MKKAELVFVPMPGLGHLVSTLELAKLLVDLNFNLSFTVLVIKSPSDQPTIAKIDSFIASTNSDRIKFINLPQGEIDKDAPPGKFMTAIIQSQRPQIKAAVKSIVRDSSSVPGSPQLAGFVFDMFLTSLTDLANEFGVPSYVFYTSGAAFLGFQLFIQAEANDNFNMTEFKDSDTEISVPTYVHSVPIKVFPSVMLKPETFDMVKRSTRELKEVKGIMVNTFSKLESHAIDSLSDSKLPCIYPVGPILNLKSPSEADQNSSLDIMEWLDQQPPSSVVFLCFGSMGSFGKDQVKEIAYALEHSGQRFLWSLRKPPADKRLIMVSPSDYEDVADVLPEGFLDRTIGIGKIIGWAPQVAILGHPSIGGFMSHCGWNSTLESIWFGVPIATWPLFAEQQLNAFEILKELGLGVEIKMDYRKEVSGEDQELEIVSAEMIKRGIECLMEQNSDIRKRVKKMSEKGRRALMDGGSSRSTLFRFISDVMDNIKIK